jgi:mono/diheme cytochrome c family protein
MTLHRLAPFMFAPLLLVLGALAVPSARAQPDGDPQQGHALAREVCARCHSVEAQRSFISPNPKAPTFRDLAETPGMTRAAMTVALTTPHAGMPMFRLSEPQQAALISYVLGLKQEP